MIFDGLGMWVWQEKYSPSTVKACIDAGVTHLIVRAWNGTGPVGSGFHQFDNYKAFVADGRIPIVPWTYVYGPGHGNAPRDRASVERHGACWQWLPPVRQLQGVRGGRSHPDCPVDLRVRTGAR